MNCVHDLIILLNATLSRNLSQVLLRSADTDSTHFSLAAHLERAISLYKFFDINGGINGFLICKTRTGLPYLTQPAE